jgi:hypothetical protein
MALYRNGSSDIVLFTDEIMGCVLQFNASGASLLTLAAGTGQYGFLGDGGPATAAQLSTPGRTR